MSAVIMNFNNEGRTRDEAYKMIKPVLKGWDIKIDDVEHVANAARVCVAKTSTAGLTVIVTVEICRGYSSGYQDPAVLGTWVMVRSHTYTPNNNGCSSIGEILLNRTFETTQQAIDEYEKRVSMLYTEQN